MTSKTAMERPAPNLWPRESALSEALEILAGVEDEMTEHEAEALIARYVDREAAVEQRDELARFVLQARAMLAARDAEAKALRLSVEQFEAAIARLERSAVRAMQLHGTDRLPGNAHLLKLRRTRGQVIVEDAAALPEEFIRVKRDEDLDLIDALLDLAVSLSKNKRGDEDMSVRREFASMHVPLEILARVDAARSRRKAPDKELIREAFREHGGGDRRAMSTAEDRKSVV